MGYILCLPVDCRFLIRILVIYRHFGFNGWDLGMVARYPISLASWSGLQNLATRLDCNLSGQGDGVSLGGLAVPALHLLLDRIEVLEKHTATDTHKFDGLYDRLDAMDRRIESLVGRSVPATECGPKPRPEPLALHELRAVLEYAVGLAAASDSNQLFFNGFMECRRMMIRAIELRLQAFD